MITLTSVSVCLEEGVKQYPFYFLFLVLLVLNYTIDMFHQFKYLGNVIILAHHQLLELDDYFLPNLLHPTMHINQPLPV